MKHQPDPLTGLITSIVVTATCLGVYYVAPLPQPVPFVAAHANKYQLAQSATVVVETPHGFGTGFVIRRGDKLFVWTARHVVSHSDEVKVGRFVGVHDRKSGVLAFKARVLCRFAALDVALLQIDAPVNAFGNVSFGPDAVVGNDLFHVGNFWGPDYDGSVSRGIVSQVNVKPSDPEWPWKQALDQGDFAAMPGSSGGPVFNARGEVVGVLVGGPHAGADRIVCYVPVREIRADAKAEGVSWAVDYSIEEFSTPPSDALLDKLADHAKLPPALPEIISITILPPKKK